MSGGQRGAPTLDSLPPALVPVALHATDAALALVCAPDRLLLFAAGSRRLLLDASLPGGAFTASTSVALTEAGDWLAWTDPAAGLFATPVAALRSTSGRPKRP